MPALEAEKQATDLAQRFHLSGVPTALARASGGERIRLSAVRGLLPRRTGEGPPPLVVADEPTAGLDPRAARALATELIDLASTGESIVVVITHDPQLFVPRLPDDFEGETEPTTSGDARGEITPSGVRLLECTLGDHAAREVREIGRLLLEPGPVERPLVAVVKRQCTSALEAIGAVTLSPIAFVWGVLGLRRPVALCQQVLGDALGPGTQLFTLTGSLLVAATVAYFIFEQTPRPELVEPLLLPEILKATGHTLVRVVLPLAACGLVATKLGAAQAARLASAVRSGLLETLALARWRLESFALVPTVLAQILCMAIATGLALAGGVLAAALVYSAGHPDASLRLSLDLMLAGPAKAPSWREFLVAKVVCSGFLAGTIAALFGHAPGTSEDDVAKAVHRTLLWGVLCVITCQCVLIVAEFAASPK
ncbi:MAG: ABC transporter permease [Planctomycetota bacterium]|nr:ABC transporter permease [Planctomycetota bacterium]